MPLNKTKIEWCDYTINPVKGLCPMHCKTPEGYEYCYAAGERGLYKRFKWNPEIRFDQTVFFGLPQKPSKVFVGSTIELFGDWVKPEWLETIFTICRQHNKHTFIFLTKQPQNLIKWSPFPENCWVGVSVCNDKMLDVAVDKLEDIDAKVKFISFEPLLEHLTLSLDYAFYYSGISWVVIGQQTPIKDVTRPKVTWISEIILAADKAEIPVFVKNNIIKDIEYEVILSHHLHKFQRQEFPKSWAVSI